jgi:hypothetical protein
MLGTPRLYVTRNAGGSHRAAGPVLNGVRQNIQPDDGIKQPQFLRIAYKFAILNHKET